MHKFRGLYLASNERRLTRSGVASSLDWIAGEVPLLTPAAAGRFLAGGNPFARRRRTQAAAPAPMHAARPADDAGARAESGAADAGAAMRPKPQSGARPRS